MKRSIFILSAGLLVSISSLSQKKMTIDEAVMGRGEFSPENLSGLKWVDDSDTYSYIKDDALMVQPVKGRPSSIPIGQLNSWTGLKMQRVPNIKWTSSSTFFFQNESRFIEVNTKKKKSRTLLDHNSSAASHDYHIEANVLAFTIDNDVFIKDEASETQLTKNADGVVSGQAIARYEFGIGKGTFWSPDGSKLAYYEKDESRVSQYPLVNYDTKPATVDMIRYPMAGAQGEIASVVIYHRNSGKQIYLNLEGGKKDDSFYATNVTWDPNGESIYVVIVNREQDHCWLKQFDSRTGNELRTLLEETNPKYVEPEHPPIFNPENSSEFLWFSERNGIDNLYKYNTAGQLLAATNFLLPVKRILGFDKSGKNCFVEAIAVNPTELHVYRVNVATMKADKVTSESGTHHASLSSSGKYLLDNWSNLDTPRKIDLLNSTGKVMDNLLTAADPMEGYSWSKPELVDIQIDRARTFHSRIIKPSNFDPNKQYPVLVYVYNGPHVQLISNSWMAGASLWMYSMAEEGYIIFTTEGRGSSARGFDFESAVHRQMGTVELDDQEDCVKWLKDQPYTDSKRFAVHGWSYGGFMTTSLMLKKPGLFEVGVAGGPVIDWRNYEIMYGERYMDTPQENPEGYYNSDLKNHVTNLQGDLLLIHGAVDDVVVMQHNMEFLEKCVSEGVQVDFFAYPGHPHNVRGKDRVHLMKKVLGYIMDRL